MSPPTDVIITGQIRDPRIFITSVLAMLELRPVGKARRILVSVWEEDLQRHGALIDAIRGHGAEVFTSRQRSGIRSVGNYWEQLITLDRGLMQIEDDTLVFKTRSDLLFLNGARTVEGILDSNSNRWCHSMGISHRIWIPSFVAFQPFFMADQCYLALSQDLRKFVRYDAQIEALETPIPLYPGSPTHPSAASAEIRFWIQPFMDLFPVLRHYRDSWPLSSNGHPAHVEVNKLNLGTSVFKQWLSLYWHILDSCFRISEGSFVLAAGLDSSSNVVVRARSHSNNSDKLVLDGMSPVNNFPVSFSSDSGLKSFMLSDESRSPPLYYHLHLRQAFNYSYDKGYMDALRSYTQGLVAISNNVTLGGHSA